MTSQPIFEEPLDSDADRPAHLDSFDLYVREVEARPRMSQAEERQVAGEIEDCRQDIIERLRSLVLQAAEAVELDPEAARRLREELVDPANERKLEAIELRIHALVASARRAGEVLRRGGRSEPMQTLRRARRLLSDIASGFGVAPAALERVATEINETRERMTAAKQRLVEANLRLVLYFARRMKWRGVDVVDLVQEGNMALLRAVDSYDPNRGFAFGSFACTAIRRAMSRFGSKTSRPVHVPSEVRARRQRIRQAERYLTTQEGVAPTWAQIAEYLDLPLAHVVDALDTREESLSLDDPVEGAAPIIDRIADDTAVDVVDSLGAAQADRQVRQTIAGLETRDRRVLESRFDLDNRGAATLADIGREHGITRERARQLEARALSRLRTRGSESRGRCGGRRPYPSRGPRRVS